MRKILIIISLFSPLWGVAQSSADLFERAKQEVNLNSQIELLTQIIEKSPNHVGAYHYRADAYRALGDMRRAMLDYNRVVTLRPKDPFRYYARGLAYQTSGEHGLALNDFSKAISLKPSYKPFYLARARAYRAQGKYSLALADYKKYVDNWQQAPVEILYEVIPVSLDAYRYDSVKEQLKTLELLGDDSAQRYLWLGRLLQNENKWDESISAFSKAVNRNLEFVEAYQLRGNAFKELGDYPAALEDYTRVLALAPDAYWFNRRGLMYEEMKNFEKAVADYARAIELDPTWAIAYNNRGFAYFHLKDYAAAKADFEMAIKLEPSAPTPYVNLAGLYWTWKKDRKSMNNNLEKAVNHHFTNYESLFEEDQKGWMFKGVNHTAEFRSILYK